MELSKQQKAIDRKFAYNTGKLPGFYGGSIGGVSTSGMTPNFYAQSNPNYSNPNYTINGLQKQIASSQASGTPLIKNAPSNNGGPTQSDSAAASISPWFALGAWAGGGILEGLGRIKSADEHLADAGTSQQSINGISYTQQNGVDSSKIMSDYDQNTAKDFLTNPFRGITSIFGRGKAKREAENAAKYANIQQLAARDNAYAQYLKLDNAKKYGNMEDQALYAANGKLPKYDIGKVATAFGQMIGQPNARVSNGEVIARQQSDGSYSMYRVPGLKNNRDGKLAVLGDNDFVFTNKYGISDNVWRTGDIAGNAAKMVAATHPSYKHGKLPGCKEGWLGNFIPSALGSLASIDQMLMAYKNKPYRPNTYAGNPYETEGLSTLAGLRINPYPIITQLRDAEFRSNRAVDIAGGLSGSQRNAARLANLNTTQKNISNLLSSIQQQNNAYRANYAQAALNAGQQARTARMQANQWDLDMYSKAHAARLNGMQMGMRNLLDQTQQYYKNEFDRNQFNKTIGLYEADQKQRRDTLDWQMKYMKNPSYNQSTRGIKTNPSIVWDLDDWNRYKIGRSLVGFGFGFS